MCAKLKGSLRIVFLRGRERLARPERFELPTYCSGGNRSIHLSYGRAELSLHPGSCDLQLGERDWERLGGENRQRVRRTVANLTRRYLEPQLSSLSRGCLLPNQ